MKIHNLSVVVAAGFLLAASCSAPLQPNRVLVSHPSSVASGQGLAGTIDSKVNAYRRTLGKPPLRRHAGLDRLAWQHAESMRISRGKSGKGIAGDLSHDGFEERTLHARRLMGMSDLGENVGTCRGSRAGAAGTLVTAWSMSAGHRMNLKGAWSRTGIGVAIDDDGTVFAVQLFGNGDPSHLAVPNRMRSF